MDAVRGEFEVTFLLMLRGQRTQWRGQAFAWIVGLFLALALGRVLGNSTDWNLWPAAVVLVLFPVIFIAGIYWTWRELAPTQRHVVVEIGKDAVVWSDGDGNRLSLTWATHDRVVETPSLYLFHLQGGGVRWLPRSAFSDRQITRIREFIAASGVQARLT